MLPEAIFWCKNIQLFILFIILLPCTKMPCSNFSSWQCLKKKVVVRYTYTLIHPCALIIRFYQLKLQHLGTGVQVSSRWTEVPQEFFEMLKVLCCVQSILVVRNGTMCYMLRLPLRLRTQHGPSLTYFSVFLCYFFNLIPHTVNILEEYLL